MVTLKTEGGLITRPTEIAQSMILLPDDTGDETEELRFVRELSARPVDDWDNEVVEMRELQGAVARQKNGRAPGHAECEPKVGHSRSSLLALSERCLGQEHSPKTGRKVPSRSSLRVLKNRRIK